MSFEKIIIILVVILTILIALIISMNITVNNSEQDGYTILEKFNITEHNKNKIIQKLDLIDNILLAEFDSEKGVEQQFIYDVCIKYIFNNYDVFEDKIIYLDKIFVYEEDDTTYSTNYYMDKTDFHRSLAYYKAV